MGHALLSCVVVLAVSLLDEAPGQSGQPLDDRAEILRLYGELSDALTRRDRDALQRIVAPGYTLVSPRGRLMIRDVYIGNRLRGVEVESARFDQVSVRLYGATAVVTSLAATDFAAATNRAPWQQLPDGGGGNCAAPRDISTARTDTWVKREGRWQLAATHLAPIGFLGAGAASDRSVLCGLNAEDLRWVESPLFPGARVAALAGEPYSGPYAVRLQRPDGHLEQPHRHESDETVSVVSGVLHVGMGDRVDRSAAQVFRAGAHVVIPARTAHYSWVEGATVIDASWNGSAEPAPMRDEVAVPVATLQSYAGTYQFGDSDGTVAITLDGAQLSAQLSGAPASFPIYAESDTRFFLKSAPPGSSVAINLRIEFSIDANGHIVGLTFGARKAVRLR